MNQILERPITLTAPAEALPLWWTELGIPDRQKVTGGWAQVRALLGSIDGEDTPWVTIQALDENFQSVGPWCQVLGDQDTCILEIGEDGLTPGTVLRTGTRNPHAPVAMPGLSSDWIPTVRADEAMSVAEMIPVAVTYMQTGMLLPGYLGHRGVYDSPYRN